MGSPFKAPLTGGGAQQWADYVWNAISSINEVESAAWKTMADSVANSQSYVYNEVLESEGFDSTLGFATTGLAGTLGAIGIGLVTDPVVAGCLDCGDVPSNETNAAWAASDQLANAWPAGYLENVVAPPSLDDSIGSFETIYEVASPTVVNVIDFMPDPISTVTVDLASSLDFGSFEDSFTDFSDYGDFGDFGFSDYVDYGDYGDYVDSYSGGYGGGGGGSSDSQWTGDYEYLWA